MTPDISSLLFSLAFTGLHESSVVVLILYTASKIRIEFVLFAFSFLPLFHVDKIKHFLPF